MFCHCLSAFERNRCQIGEIKNQSRVLMAITYRIEPTNVRAERNQDLTDTVWFACTYKPVYVFFIIYGLTIRQTKYVFSKYI